MSSSKKPRPQLVLYLVFERQFTSTGTNCEIIEIIKIKRVNASVTPAGMIIYRSLSDFAVHNERVVLRVISVTCRHSNPTLSLLIDVFNYAVWSPVTSARAQLMCAWRCIRTRTICLHRANDDLRRVSILIDRPDVRRRLVRVMIMFYGCAYVNWCRVLQWSPLHLPRGHMKSLERRNRQRFENIIMYTVIVYIMCVWPLHVRRVAININVCVQNVMRSRRNERNKVTFIKKQTYIIKKKKMYTNIRKKK